MNATIDRLFEQIEAISRRVDQADWTEAGRLLREHDEMVRETVRRSRSDIEPHWRDLVDRQRTLSLKFAAMHSELGKRMSALRRNRVAACQYLQSSAP